MRAVNTVSLNGNAWQIEADGCEALGAYLKSAEARLAGDPDRAEILADLEQAIADKLARHVSAHKNVVSAEEITKALQEMGPVETGASAEPRPGSPGAAEPGPTGQGNPGTGGAADPGPRRLFQIREGGMFSGVCNGLAAFFGIDVTLVRVIFVLFAVLTGGIGAVVYLVMMMVVPVAMTSEQMAAAHGRPFSAAELIGGARAAHDAGWQWRQQWRDQRRMWRDQRRQWRRQRHAWSFGAGPFPSAGWSGPVPPPEGLLLGLLRAALLIALLVGIVGAVEGWPLLGWDWAAAIPHWVGVVAVCVVYGALKTQLRMAWYYGHVSAGYPGHALVALLGTVMWLLVLLAAGWYVAHHWPQVQDFLQRVVQALQSAFDDDTPRHSVST